MSRASGLLGAVRRTDPRHLIDPRRWTLAVRVVVLTIVLSAIAVFTVGTYLSSVISDGLYEQRRAQVLDESTTIRLNLSETLNGTAGATSTQAQDAAAGFVQGLRSTDSGTRRDAALVPVDTTSSTSTIASDRAVLDLVDSDLRSEVASSSDSLVWRSVGRPDASGTVEPQLLVGTRVVVPSSGTYDLFLLYSLSQEQQTLVLVQRAMLGGGAVMLALVVGIAIVVARLVTSPLQRAASAAEKIAAGDLGSRVETSGSDEIAKVGRSFNAMATNLEQKIEDLTELSRVQQRFVSDVSHELRTPLTTIRMATAVLEDHREQFDPDLARTTTLLSAQVRRFETLLADLLEISRFDAGAAVLEARPMDLGDLVMRAAEDARPLAGSRGSLLDVVLSSRSTEAVMDPRRIERVLRNLLTNAIEHGAGRPVVVRTGADDDAVAVVVQDFGVGLSPDDAEQVFARFWRADPSRARTLGGTGLGLAISLEDAHLHDGWLQAWGRKGQGAVFRLTLPRRPGTQLVRSPLALERSFTGPERGQASVGTVTVEEPVRADALPLLSSTSAQEADDA
ncbi:sensor histidine kinase [Brachybacterium endophyticum]|uniref:Sensor histidine kinase MtrB n=1 Tax=Brachybacterium endophyticum TaxID=2182385 RepID=A0A2U2RH30_9MICO|nr:MtrAB system histidine kinase MtrB [Brachybacterium endophyticum]PWH05158.1 sensor histidine kinase [Brachybacterium endophyticum]